MAIGSRGQTRCPRSLLAFCSTSNQGHVVDQGAPDVKTDVVDEDEKPRTNCNGTKDDLSESVVSFGQERRALTKIQDMPCSIYPSFSGSMENSPIGSIPQRYWRGCVLRERMTGSVNHER